MSNPSLEDRKALWLHGYSRDCFGSVSRACDFLLKNPGTLDESVTRVLISGIIVTYAKAFTNCHGAGRLQETIIPSDCLKTHRFLMDLRHKLIAHLDAINLQADDPRIGNLNQIRLKQLKREHILYVWMFSPQILPLLDVKQLATRLSEKTDYHIEKFRKQHIAKATIRPGEYVLNLDPKDPRAFVPVVPVETLLSPGSQPPHPKSNPS